MSSNLVRTSTMASALTGFGSWRQHLGVRRRGVQEAGHRFSGPRQIDALIRKINLQARLVASCNGSLRNAPGELALQGHLAAKGAWPARATIE